MTSVSTPPRIPSLPPGTARPLWSVMIPVCNRTTFIEQAVESVLAEGIPPDDMQICIVDNSTQKIDWQSTLSPRALQRVAVFACQDHLPIIANWNRCIALATGRLIQILHDDDYVLPGFYNAISRREAGPGEAALYATRCFHADESGHYVAVSQRLPTLETVSARDVTAFFNLNHLQSVVVAIRRSFFEEHGGFDPAFGHTADWELFVRAISTCGGVVLPDVLGVYRLHANTDTGAGVRTAKNIKDEARLMDHLAACFAGFPRAAVHHRLFIKTLLQEERFERLQDHEAANAHRLFRREFATWKNLLFRCKRSVSRAIHTLGMR